VHPPLTWQRSAVDVAHRAAEELKKHYLACTTGDLPPQLIELSKRLDEELLKKGNRAMA
jgi:hypothetical protein